MCFYYSTAIRLNCKTKMLIARILLHLPRESQCAAVEKGFPAASSEGVE